MLRQICARWQPPLQTRSLPGRELGPALRELHPEESQTRCFGVSEVTSALILREQRIIKYICGIQCDVLTEVDFVGCLYQVNSHKPLSHIHVFFFLNSENTSNLFFQ